MRAVPCVCAGLVVGILAGQAVAQSGNGQRAHGATKSPATIDADGNHRDAGGRGQNPTAAIRLLGKVTVVPGGARPEVVATAERVFVVYLQSNVGGRPRRGGGPTGGTFDVKIFNPDLSKLIASKTLVRPSEAHGRPTDIRVASGGKHLYAFYETVVGRETGGFLWGAKFTLDDRFERVARVGPIARGKFWTLTEAGDELINDPIPLIGPDTVLVITRLKAKSPSKQEDTIYRVREFTQDLDKQLRQFDLDLSEVADGEARQAGALYWRDHFYMVVPTTSEEGSFQIDMATPSDLLMVKVNRKWEIVDSKLISDTPGDVETFATGFQQHGGRFFVTYKEGSPRDGFFSPLKIYDENFNLLLSETVRTAGGRGESLRSSVAVTDRHIYVGYGVGSGPPPPHALGRRRGPGPRRGRQPREVVVYVYERMGVATARGAAGLASDRTSGDSKGKLRQAPQPAPLSQRPTYVTLGFHWDFPTRRERPGPTPSSRGIKAVTELFEKYRVRAHYGFCGIVAQQLSEDFPETIEKIRKLKMAIGYHGGTGHNPRAPVARAPETSCMSLEEVIAALWQYETQALYPEDHARARQPIPDRTGGWLAIQQALGVTPLQTDAAGRGALYEALGAGYPISQPELPTTLGDTLPGRPGTAVVATRAYSLPGLHEIHVFGRRAPGKPGGIPATYYGKRPGEDAPVTVDIREWLRILAENLPRDRAFQVGFMCHNQREWTAYERFVAFLASHPDDFQIVAPDPEGWQWKPQNSPLEFHRRTYGVSSLEDMLKVEPPVEKIKQACDGDRRRLGDRAWQMAQRTQAAPPRKGRGRPRRPPPRPPRGPIRRRPEVLPYPKTLAKDEILSAADFLLCHWPRFTHDGDFGGPPRFVEAGDKMLSLADAFQSFVLAIAHWQRSGRMPESLTISPLGGPVDWPSYELGTEPKLDLEKRMLGYHPAEIERRFLPDPQLVASQGLPACGDFHIWIPTHTEMEAQDMLDSVKAVAEAMTDRVPGLIHGQLLCHTRPGQPDAKREVALNPAEFLYALAQQYRSLAARGKPNDVVLVSMKVTSGQACKLLLPLGGDRFDGFIYRGHLTPAQLEAAWTRPRRD